MNFILAGAFSQFSTLSIFLLKNKNILDKYSITVYDGIGQCKWNGGRINREINVTEAMINFYYSREINIALTFSNPEIDLSDEVGNNLLKKFHRKGNRIILINDDLRKHIRKNYPLYELTYSITGIGTINVPMLASDIKRYQQLELYYNLIVPRMEHVFDKRFNELDSKKYEIMLNDTCIYNCPYYKEHFEAIAKQNTLYKTPWREQPNCKKIEECWIPNFNPDNENTRDKQLHGESYGMDLNQNQISKLLNIGISNFKISGRELSQENYTNELYKYLKGNYNGINREHSTN